MPLSDTMQESISVCQSSDIAVAVWTSVVATYPDRNELLIGACPRHRPPRPGDASFPPPPALGYLALGDLALIASPPPLDRFCVQTRAGRPSARRAQVGHTISGPGMVLRFPHRHCSRAPSIPPPPASLPQIVDTAVFVATPTCGKPLIVLFEAFYLAPPLTLTVQPKLQHRSHVPGDLRGDCGRWERHGL